MAKKVTQRDIEQMNEAYLTIGTYSGVARALGWSASTVKRYINPNYTRVSIVKKEITIYLIQMMKNKVLIKKKKKVKMKIILKKKELKQY